MKKRYCNICQEYDEYTRKQPSSKNKRIKIMGACGHEEEF